MNFDDMKPGPRPLTPRRRTEEELREIERQSAELYAALRAERQDVPGVLEFELMMRRMWR